MGTERVCKDCTAEFGGFPPPARQKRPVVEKSGGRCATHWREEKERRKAASHEKRVQGVYGLGPGDYASLYEFQGGRCALCRRATGATKKLAVDHCHRSGAVRGLACSVCNRILGHTRDDVEFFLRVMVYLTSTPYERMRAGLEFFE